MQTQTIQKAVDQETDNYTQHYILMRLAAQCDANGVVDVGMLRLAQMCNMQHQTLKRGLASLVEQGIIDVIKTRPCMPDLVQLKF